MGNRKIFRDINNKETKVVRLNKSAKMNFYRSLDVSNLTNDRRFWKTFKPLFSSKSGKITLVENESIISCESQIAECFNQYFVNITDSLPIEPYVTLPSYVPLQDPIIDALRKYENHPSIALIKNNMRYAQTFEFKPISYADIVNEINNLDSSKKTSGTLSVDIIKRNTGICRTQIAEYFNSMLLSCEFPDPLKAVDVSAIHKGSDPTSKRNYRPISVPSAMSKVFERLLEKQIVPFIDTKISALLCAYRKNYNAEQALIRVTEKIRKTLDSKGVAGMISMDLSKAFDCMPHDLLIAKLNAYGFGTQSLRLIANYLSNRKQRVKIGATYSSWLKTKTGVPQGSVLGPLLFNIFINDFIYIIKQSEVCNFADDNTIFSCGNSFEVVALSLEEDISKSMYWFKTNQMVVNAPKFQAILFGLNSKEDIVLEVGGCSIDVANSVTLLGVTIDSKLKFNKHVLQICQKANNKISAFSRISKYLDEKQSLLLYNSFIISQFNYCSLIWMFGGKAANKELNRSHKRALRILRNDYSSPFEELLRKSNECTIHIKNLKKLMLEVYKCLKNENPSFMWNMFHEKSIQYNLRSKNLLMLPQTNTIKYGNDSIVF